MAVSNRDRVGRGFEILATGLEPFVDERMSATTNGRDWTELLAARDSTRHGVAKTYSKSDPQVLLRVITEERRVFQDHLSRVEWNFASELRDTRNRWAHNEPFSADDTYRALDTMERLLTAVGAPEQADQVRRLKLDHQRQVIEAETRKAVKAASTAPRVEGLGLKPWREVIRPHEDVATNNFNASEFAADLHMVSQRKEGSEEYVDPVEFFRRTYLTEGLRDLLTRAVRRVGGDLNAPPVINLQTNFGGGKTHSMLALYHIFSGQPLTEYPQEVQELLAGSNLAELGSRVHRVTLVGNHIPPGQVSVKEDGTEVHTLWGELAWQLGKRAAYDLVADADRTRTNPGDRLRDLIAAYAPCLILIDEWVAYARQLYGRDDLPAGTFDTQFTFAQTLTEVVKSVQGALLVISIPASDDGKKGKDGEDAGSDLEVGGTNGREALRRLQNIVRRVADQWRPASAQESFEIVRRRLFQEPDGAARADINAVARQFARFYAEHKGEFPRGCSEREYEDRIKAAYPIHPELFDRLYEDWSTLERFQRTRGVLRLMSAVVHALWVSGDAGPLIMPGSVPLDNPHVASELTQYLEDVWKPIVDADVDGPGATPVEIDVERPMFGQRALTRRLARTIFLGSAATLRSAHKGIEQQRVWLGVAVPGDTVGHFGSALHMLADRATYLYVDGARYWYDTQASVSRTAKDYAERLQIEEVWAEIKDRLNAHEQRVRGDFAGVHIAPDTSAEIPDTEEARLVILAPSAPHAKGDTDSAALRFARQALETRGSAQRNNRNMLVFLAADRKRVEDLEAATREYLAWKNISGRIKELNLSPQQVSQVETRLANADQAVALRIASTYIWALVPVQPDPARPVQWDVIKVEGAKERLAERTSDKLRQTDQLRAVHAARLIRTDLNGALRSVWERGHVSVGELWTYYCRYPYLPRLRDRAVFDAGVLGVLEELTWELEGFALADSYDEASKRYVGLAIPHEDRYGQVTDATLLVHPDVAKEQRAREKAEAAVVRAAEDGVAVTPVQPGVFRVEPDRPEPVPDAEPKPSNTRFYGVYRVNPERYSRDLNRVVQEILPHLAAAEGVDLEITVEISARKADGFPEDKIRIVTENARTLKFEQYGFEND
ncbi:ATPase AAA [Carbonactinospora thermoautotrophica]|uniref:ATPase AAA n=1 Tax=Carbonactinospora thermoautotrophica TaxID=1469144 RepID=A0A132NAC9_9ACTN|nr:Swt1 family HEPN domain-containing protein [Carbonactinospora thermoautotrophica]KWW97478.1 ATPase AAA [Carbonactinospora thermoautotrophica]KWX07109.1 ATPase AAA [Carbonactinospora thermoautotrophica]